MLVLLTACISCDSTRPGPNLEGAWVGQLALNTPSDTISLFLTQVDTTLYADGFLRIGPLNDFVGPTYSPFQAAGTVSGGKVNLVIAQGPATSRLSGRIVGDQLPLVFTYLDIGSYPIVLRRVPSQSGGRQPQQTRLDH